MTTRNASDEAAIRTVIDNQAQAVRDKDAKAVVSCYAADSVIFDLAPPLRNPHAGAALERSLNDWFATWQGPIGYETRGFKITASDTVAFAHGFVRISGTKVGGTHDGLWFRLTLGLTKVGGAWKIAHDHASVPFYMDGSYRAAIDLQPSADTRGNLS